MSYVNVMLAEGEKQTYDLGDGREKTPGLVTIDREKGYILFTDYTEIDNPVNIHFGFVYQGKVITMVLNRDIFTDEDVMIWKIASIHIPEGLSREEVLSELRSALKEYGCFGSPISPRFGKISTNILTDF